MKEKCKVCKVYVENYGKEKVCTFEQNGCEDICPFNDDYLDLTMHDKELILATLEVCD